jgi:hypothetical protein
MTFNLHITFGGMCLFVRDYQEKRLCVLLPKVPPGIGHPHTATLHFALDGQVQSVPMPPHLDFGELRGEEKLALDFPQRLVDLDYITCKPVSRDLLDARGSDVISSLITLRAGYCRGASKGARWRLGHRPPRFMATTVEWVIKDVSSSAFELLGEYTQRDQGEWIDFVLQHPSARQTERTSSHRPST